MCATRAHVLFSFAFLVDLSVIRCVFRLRVWIRTILTINPTVVIYAMLISCYQVAIIIGCLAQKIVNLLNVVIKEVFVIFLLLFFNSLHFLITFAIR